MTLVRGPATVATRLPGVRRRLRRTPGRLALATAVLVVLGLATGVAGALGVRQRIDLVNGAVARSGDLTVAVQRLYRALSDADATAASAFLTGGVEPVALRERYQSDIDDAAAALALVSAGRAGGDRGDAAVAQITTELPVYTGLVETARVYNRQGVPIGGAYLREASGLMRERLLPAVQRLSEATARELDDARDRAAAFPWFAVLLGLLTIAALVAVQRYLARTTNRVLNIGLVAATAATVGLVLWLGVSAVLAAGRLDASREQGSEPVARLAGVRVAALQARADEAHTLIARGNGARFEEDYVRAMADVTGRSGLPAVSNADPATRNSVDAATGEVRRWLAAHQELRALDDGGEYARAVAAAVGTGPESTASIFNQLDAHLADAIEHNGERFDRDVHRAAGALAGADTAVAVLATLLIVGAALGIQRRLAEYR
ncbi:hypothetical protein [Micromonospora narathiwatensis]|uniref:hypothetical protein n=1 Tax=Micromonospora narathiwatensis TaxID=299146 RepID=UPI000B854931|nr:hypothetical protein [Micromonospora narathiwatensis]